MLIFLSSEGWIIVTEVFIIVLFYRIDLIGAHPNYEILMIGLIPLENIIEMFLNLHPTNNKKLTLQPYPQKERSYLSSLNKQKSYSSSSLKE